MVRRYNRLLVAFYVITDAVFASCALLLGWLIRFQTDIITDIIPAEQGRCRRSSSTVEARCRSLP